MKDILIDMCLVGLLLFFMNSFFNDNHIQEEIFNQNISLFEQDVENEQVIDYDEGIYDNQEDNEISQFFKVLSDWCIQLIQTFILIISNFISKLL
ncbi:MAG: hypothetical protein ACI4SR_05555 [Faecalibacillus sp.]